MSAFLLHRFTSLNRSRSIHLSKTSSLICSLATRRHWEPQKKSESWDSKLICSFFGLKKKKKINLQSRHKLLPDACWCAYFIGKDIFNDTLAGFLRGFLHILSGTWSVLMHTYSIWLHLSFRMIVAKRVSPWLVVGCWFWWSLGFSLCSSRASLQPGLALVQGQQGPLKNT